MELSIFFQGWQGLLRVGVVGLLAYAGLVLMLRIAGKRTLSKMNAFDLVVTVALGSTLASVLLSRQVALAEGLFAFGLLIAMQFVVAWLSTRSRRFESLLKSEPTMLFYQGAFLRAAMRSVRVTETEVLAAIRQQGLSSPAQVRAVVLENDGSLAVVRQTGADQSETALAQLKPESGPPPES